MVKLYVNNVIHAPCCNSKLKEFYKSKKKKYACVEKSTQIYNNNVYDVL